MSEIVASPHRTAEAAERVARRHAAERRFRRIGALAIALALGALIVLLGTIFSRGIGAFSQHVLTIEIALDPEQLGVDLETDPGMLRADFAKPIREAARALSGGVEGRRERREHNKLISNGAPFEIRDALIEHPDWLGSVRTFQVPLSADADMLLKGAISRDLPESDRVVSDRQIAWLDGWLASGRVDRVFNRRFFTSGDSRDPELAGIWGAVVGSLWTIGITLLLCFPVGVASAVYLEEFASKNRWNDFIEVNINNLAAVPSIVFGLLGLAVFLNFAGLPRSAPLVGGMVLALMTLPTVIIASRSAIASVPPSIREAALGVGASPLQVVTNHVLPLALPGILTGTIIGMARALGETAPLLMIGMVAFIVDVPAGPSSPATVLPVQVYLWADSPERAFVEKTSAAIMVLLLFLITMNLAAVLLRNRFERRW